LEVALPIECVGGVGRKRDKVRAYTQKQQPMLHVKLQDSLEASEVVLGGVFKAGFRVGFKPEGSACAAI
jgi:hypothetical protein